MNPDFIPKISLFSTINKGSENKAVGQQQNFIWNRKSGIYYIYTVFKTLVRGVILTFGKVGQ